MAALTHSGRHPGTGDGVANGGAPADAGLAAPDAAAGRTDDPVGDGRDPGATGAGEPEGTGRAAGLRARWDTVGQRLADRPLAAALRHRFPTVVEGPDRGVGGLGWSAPLVAAGFALITIAYWATGDAERTRSAMFWGGQLLAFAPAALRVIGVRASTAERYGLVVLYALGQSFTKWVYSPDRFEFGDELQHLSTAGDLIRTGHYQPNFALPVSPHFPVLENVTAAIAQLGRLTVFQAGLAVATAAHLLLAVATLLLFTRIAGSVRLGTAAALIYATNPHQSYVNTSFVYEVVAIPLLVVLLWLVSAPIGRRLAPVAVLLLATVAVAHHVTSYLTIVLLAFLAVGFALARAQRGLSRQSTVLALTALAVVVAWTATEARSVLGYLRGPAELLTGRSPTPTANSAAVAVPALGLTDTALAAAGVLVIFIAVPAALVLVRLRPVPPALRVFVLLGAAYYPAVALRFVSSDGQELAGRSFTYVYLGVAPAVAVVAVHLWGRRRSGLRRPAAVAIALVMLGAGVSTGWPPSWERLPGRQIVSGFETSLDPQTVQAAEWAERVLGPGNRILSDTGDAAAMSSYGRQFGVDNLPDVFYGPRWTPAISEQLRHQDISFVLVDRRMSTEAPITGLFFADAPATGDPSRPVPAAALAKFAAVPGISTVYDTGTIVIYNVRAAVFDGG